MANRPGVKTPNAQRGKTATAKPMGGTTPAVIPAAPVVKKPRVSIPQFIAEVRAEARKITWTSWKETWITSVMVFIMVLLTAFFFFFVDAGLRLAIEQLLKLAAG